jgi:mannose-6-phosphate isomerase-like protein (cupin superfamily)
MNICHFKCLPEKTKTCCIKTKVTCLNQTIDSTKTEIELYEMQPAGNSPLHNHKAQHTILVLEGEGVIFDGEKTFPIYVDGVISILADEAHQIKNVAKKPLRFLAITTR